MSGTIGSVSPIWSVFPGETTSNTNKSEGDASGLFGDIFRSAIENVKETDAEKNQVQYLMATGQLDNPAELTIASTKAATSVELLVQLRNKALDSYNELMRIGL
ncbi:MAG: hypothetical protein H6Q61_521 [Firmicutes bacterium]|nr:hypothetical protein [Bacillota bacterium]